MADDFDAGAAGAAAEGTPAPSMEDTMGAVFDKIENDDGGRDGATGRFSSTKQDAGAAVGGDGSKPNSSDPANTEASGAASQPLTDAPKSWSDADKELFKSLPPATQKVILARESERDSHLTEKSREIAEKGKTYESFNQLLAPIEAEARKFNMPATTAIQQMFQRHQDLQTRGFEALKDIAKLYNISLNGSQAGGSHDDSVDPEIATLKSENQALKSRLDRFEQTHTTTQRNQLEREIDTVSNEKDKDGKPLRPHFEDLYDDMAPIVQTLKTKNPSWSISKLMTEAYERACMANPDIRAKLEADRAAKAKADDEAKAKEAAKSARRARDNNVRATGAHGAGAPKGKSFEDTMGRVFDDMHAA